MITTLMSTIVFCGNLSPCLVLNNGSSKCSLIQAFLLDIWYLWFSLKKLFLTITKVRSKDLNEYFAIFTFPLRVFK